MFLLSCHWKESCSYAEHYNSVQLQAISALLPLEASTAGAVSPLQALWVCMETLGTSELEPMIREVRFHSPYLTCLFYSVSVVRSLSGEASGSLDVSCLRNAGEPSAYM